MDPNAFPISALRPRLKPFRLYYAARLGSTNTHAAALRRARKLYTPAIVLTAHQLAGRGRGGNTWASGAGSLTVTFAVPSDAAVPPQQVPLIAGLAIRDALSTLTGIDALQIKWPNDLWHDGLKLAGLLCERVENADLIGVGLNVNLDLTELNPSLRRRVTTLAALTSRPLPMGDVLVAIAEALDRQLLRRAFGSFDSVVRQINRVHALNGRRIRVSDPSTGVVSGVCEGLDSHGRLLVRSAEGLIRVVAGHVELVT